MAKKTRRRVHPLVRWAKANSISMVTMSKQLGLSRTAIHYWNTGFRLPRPFTMQVIADYTKGAVTAHACYRYWLSCQRASA